MNGRWQDLGGPGREQAATVFAALDGARQLVDTAGPARPSHSAVWSALVSGRPLPAGVEPGPDLEAMLDRASVGALPRLAAAATEAVGIDRRAAGVRIRVIPSRSGEGPSYLVIGFDDPTARAGRLVVTADGAAPVELTLPEMTGGSVQILLDDGAPILAAVADPDARIFLV